MCDINNMRLPSWIRQISSSSFAKLSFAESFEVVHSPNFTPTKLSCYMVLSNVLEPKLTHAHNEIKQDHLLGTFRI